MSIVDSVATLQKEGFTQKELSKNLHIDQSYLSRILKGERKWPEHLDSTAAKMNWRIAIEIIDERTGGWIRNRFGELDPHPSALKEVMMKEMSEAFEALGTMVLSERKNREKQRENARKLVKELKDVVEVGMVTIGAIEEVYGLNDYKKGEKNDRQR